MINAWLIADQDVHRKKRHTAQRVWQRLHGTNTVAVTSGKTRGSTPDRDQVVQGRPPGTAT